MFSTWGSYKRGVYNLMCGVADYRRAGVQVLDACTSLLFTTVARVLCIQPAQCNGN